MPKLWDDMVGRLKPQEQTNLSDVMVIDGSNVAEYCEQHFSGSLDHNVDMIQMFPNVAPPFDRMFIEFGYMSGAATGLVEKHVSWGVLIESYRASELREGNIPLNRPEIWKLAQDVLRTTPEMENAKWLVCLMTYPGKQMAFHTGNLDLAMSCTIYPVDDQGNMLVRSNGVAISASVN